MASGSEKNLRCPVCHDIFKDPMLLSCNHNLCKECMQRCWRKKQTFECPVCKRGSRSKHPPCNLVLKNLCEAFLLERDQRGSAETLCSLHSEKLKLFCLDHQQPVCLVCRDSEKHTNHRFKPIDEAAQAHKEELQKTLKPLQEKLKLFQKAKENCDETAKYMKVQARHTKRQIKEQFKKLHKFLQEEEEARIAALRDEEKQKRKMIKEKLEALSREITSLSETIRATEEELRTEDLSFLQNYKAAVERVHQRPLLDDPEPLSGALIDVIKHLGNLMSHTRYKMKHVSPHCPVILDPNTAHPGLILSEDLTSVRWGERQKLPDNPERFDSSCIVLGCGGLDERSNSWQFEVGDSKHWVLGFAPESVQRKGRLSSKSQLSTIGFYKGTYVATSPSSPVRILPVKKQLQRIKVHQDCNFRILIFDDDTRIHEFYGINSRIKLFIATSDEVPLKISEIPVLRDSDEDSADVNDERDYWSTQLEDMAYSGPDGWWREDENHGRQEYFVGEF